MAPSDDPAPFDLYERRHVVMAAARGLAVSGLLLLAYCLVPAGGHRVGIALRVAASLIVFVGLVAWEVRTITRSRQPFLRAVVSMVVLVPLFILLFAWIYLTMSNSDPGAFDTHLDRVGALYYTVSIFSTVGFGDITARLDSSRIVVTVQMLADLAFIAVVVRVILGTASRTEARQRAGSSGAAGDPTPATASSPSP